MGGFNTQRPDTTNSCHKGTVITPLPIASLQLFEMLTWGECDNHERGLKHTIQKLEPLLIKSTQARQLQGCNHEVAHFPIPVTHQFWGCLSWLTRKKQCYRIDRNIQCMMPSLHELQ